MPEANNSNSTPTPDKKRSMFSFGRISDAASAKKVARHGGLAGLFFAAIYVLAGVSELIGSSRADRVATQNELVDFYSTLLTYVVLAALALFLTWRTSTGRGWISSILLLIWFMLDMMPQIFAGLAVEWIILYIALAIGFIDGVRGNWAGRKYAAKPSAPSIPTAPTQSPTTRG